LSGQAASRGSAARAGAALAAVSLVTWGAALAPSRTRFARDVSPCCLPPGLLRGGAAFAASALVPLLLAWAALRRRRPGV